MVALNKDLVERKRNVIMILAHDQNYAIGKDGQLLKRNKADMRWFRHMTEGRTCIVGRKTFSEVQGLEDREWICVTRNAGIHSDRDIHTSDSISHAITFAVILSKSRRMDPTIVIAGGAEIYNQALELDLVDTIYATVWPDVIEGGNTFVTPYDQDERFVLVDSRPLEDQDATCEPAHPVPLVRQYERKRV